jgi:hypothetical protein
MERNLHRNGLSDRIPRAIKRGGGGGAYAAAESREGAAADVAVGRTLGTAAASSWRRWIWFGAAPAHRADLRKAMDNRDRKSGTEKGVDGHVW